MHQRTSSWEDGGGNALLRLSSGCARKVSQWVALARSFLTRLYGRLQCDYMCMKFNAKRGHNLSLGACSINLANLHFF